MLEILPKFDSEDYIENFKKANLELVKPQDLKDVLEGTMVY